MAVSSSRTARLSSTLGAEIAADRRELGVQRIARVAKLAAAIQKERRVEAIAFGRQPQRSRVGGGDNARSVSLTSSARDCVASVASCSYDQTANAVAGMTKKPKSASDSRAR